MEKKTPVKILSDVSAIATGDSHTLLLDKHGDLYFKGFDNHFVKFENLDDTLHKLASDVVSMAAVAKVFAGVDCAFYIMDDGTLRATGRNEYGQLGDGSTTNRKAPVDVSLP